MVRSMGLSMLMLSAAGTMLILDSRCAADSVRQGLSLCFQNVIPGLFPLLCFCAMAVPLIARYSFPVLISRILGIPRGSEGIFLLGCLGGFPVAAQGIRQAVECRQLSPSDGERMLGFSSNCGAAFLFGILPGVLGSFRSALICFLIQVESACLIGFLWPGKSHDRGTLPHYGSVSVSDGIQRAARSMASICCWILIASVLCGFLRRWLFPFLPPAAALVLTGIMELTTGCMELQNVADPAIRLLLCCGFLNFGSVSVLLQIRSAAPDSISMVPCVIQKLLQSAVSVVLAVFYTGFGPVTLFLPILVICSFQKTLAFSDRIEYNDCKSSGGL